MVLCSNRALHHDTRSSNEIQLKRMTSIDRSKLNVVIMSNAVALVELVASASDSLDDRPKTNCFGCPDERTIVTRLWQGLAIASFAVNLTAIVIVDESISMIIAGIVACLIAPVVIYLQFQIQDTDTLRMVQNALRKEVNRLNEENDKLVKEVTLLEQQVQRINEKETELEAITQQQNINSDSFIQLCNTNRITLDELKAAIQDDLTQTLVTACIDSDMDQSGQYNDQEIQVLCELRLKNIPGIIVNTTLLNDEIKKLAKPINMESILSFVQHLHRTDLSIEQRIFRFDETKVIASPKPVVALPAAQSSSILPQQ